MHRDLRGISEWLIVYLGQVGDHLHRFFGRYIQFGVVGAEMCCYGFRMLVFIVGINRKADRERLDRTRADRLHQRNNG